MGTHISEKPPLATTSTVSASTPPSSSNIKIERVLNSSSASIEPFPQLSAAAHRPSLAPPPSTSPPLTTLPLSGPPAGASTHLQQYHQHQPQPLLSSEQSMAAAAVATQPAHVMQPFTRPIRFVANDGQPHAKRRRISAACKTCRKRKTRCSGEKPVCETCRQNGHSCLGYSDPSPSTPSHNSQQQQQRQQNNNHQVSASPTPTPTATTPTEKSALKEPLIAPTPIRVSPQDQRRNPLERASSLSQQSELPSYQHDQQGAGAPSRAGSQKRKSMDYHQSEDGKVKQWDVSYNKAEAEDRGGGELTNEGPSPVLRYQTPPATQRLAHRMPYFRYFGPTAIVPGYKQMVVEVKDRSNRPRHASHSISAKSSSTSPTSTFAGLNNPTPASTITSGSSMEDIPFYDQSDSAPNHRLITHLVETFFIHLGCNFPFLRQEAFMRDVEEKRVDTILVDAVCAVAARFSTHSLVQATQQTTGAKVPQGGRRCEYGTAFANRAKSLVVDTFACPNLATVQACILLAYVEFGSNRDSGLWMFLGIAIRMAQDLGLHKLEGARGDIKGRQEAMRTRSQSTSSEDVRCGEDVHGEMGDKTQEGEVEDEEADIRERERTDTFWAVFFLDRVISSGTGRPVTIRDGEVEIDFPNEEASLVYPPPFPALIRVVRLYGRITDLLNSISDVHMVTAETLGRLSGMEAELTKIYQRLSPNIHFNVQNFRYYSSTNQSAVFLLLHFWFHTLIVLLHRPTLLIAFEGRVQELFPNSRELSMSSAKTISDILTFAELIDPRAVSGNPFTSQPIYIAACAFLQEGATHSSSNPTSRSSSPSHSGGLPTFDAITLADMECVTSRNMRPSTASIGSPVSSSDIAGVGCAGEMVCSESKQRINVEDGSQIQKISQKHALLAKSAYENYQGCYKALKGLETYWEGVKYILTVLDQKAKGIVDPLLYTAEEMESVEVHRWGANVWNRFRGSIQGDSADGGPVQVKVEGCLQTGLLPPSNLFVPERVPSPLMNTLHSDSHQAIGLSATGTTNSPNLNLTWLFSNSEHSHNPQNQLVTVTSPHGNLQPQDLRGVMQVSMHPPLPNSSFVQHGAPNQAAPSASKYSVDGSTPASDAEMLLGLSDTEQKPEFGQQLHHQVHSMDGHIIMGNTYNDGSYTNSGAAPGAFGYGIMLESEDVNMNNLGWSLPCFGYIPSYWDGTYTPTEEVG